MKCVKFGVKKVIEEIKGGLMQNQGTASYRRYPLAVPLFPVSCPFRFTVAISYPLLPHTYVGFPIS